MNAAVSVVVLLHFAAGLLELLCLLVAFPDVRHYRLKSFPIRNHEFVYFRPFVFEAVECPKRDEIGNELFVRVDREHQTWIFESFADDLGKQVIRVFNPNPHRVNARDCFQTLPEIFTCTSKLIGSGFVMGFDLAETGPVQGR